MGGGLALAGLSGNGYASNLFAAPSGMFSAAISFGALKAGVRADLFQVKSELTTIDVTGQEYKDRFAYYDPAFSFSAFIAKVFHHRALDVSIGVHAGMVTGVNKAVLLGQSSHPGFSAGIDAGVTHYFNHHIGVFGNLSPRYIFNTTDALAFPLNLGVSFRL